MLDVIIFTGLFVAAIVVYKGMKEWTDVVTGSKK